MASSSLQPIAERSERDSLASMPGSTSAEAMPRVLEEWETDEKGYIFEERLATGTTHKDLGNEHFKKGEWELALRRYERALHHCTFDPMQMYDLMDKHKADAYAVQASPRVTYLLQRRVDLGRPEMGRVAQCPPSWTHFIQF